MNLFEVALEIQGYPFRNALKELNKVQKLENEEFSLWQEKKRWEIVAYHFKNNNFYRNLFSSSQPSIWDSLPILNKSDLQKPLEQLLSKGFNRNNCYISNTSGSSGTPFYFAKDRFSHALTWAYVRNSYSRVNVSYAKLQAYFFGIPLEGKAAKIERIKDKIMNRIRFPVFDLSDDVLNNYVKKFSNEKIHYIYGYTNSVKHFSLYLIKNGIELKKYCPTLSAVIVTSEMCSDHDREIINTGMGVPVILEYGASETGIIGISDATGEMKVCEEALFVELNQKNELLVTSLYNKAFPIIRYNIGDIVNLKKSKEGLYIENIEGRSDDMVKLPGGKVAAGLTLYYCSKEILTKSGKINELYVTQKTLDNFVVSCVAESELTSNDKAIVQQAFDLYLQPGLILKFEKSEYIRRKKNGKFQLFHSEII